MGKETVKIVIADAQYLTRAGLRHLLDGQARMQVVAEALDPDELMAAVAKHGPQVVVIDPHNTDAFSQADMAEVMRRFPTVGILLMTDTHDRARIQPLLDLGVHCILTKHCGPEEIVSAILATSRREKFFCNKVLELILQKPDVPEMSCRPSNLSAREAEIVTLVAQGVSTKEIADRLCLSLHTVYTHRKNILRKLEMNSASEMIRFAMQTGLV